MYIERGVSCKNACTVNSRYFEVDGTIFLQVQITRSSICTFRVIWTCKNVPKTILVLEKSIKMYFGSDRRFELRRIGDIGV